MWARYLHVFPVDVSQAEYRPSSVIFLVFWSREGRRREVSLRWWYSFLRRKIAYISFVTYEKKTSLGTILMTWIHISLFMWSKKSRIYRESTLHQMVSVLPTKTVIFLTLYTGHMSTYYLYKNVNYPLRVC